MGTVYLAGDGAGARAAVKVIHPHLLADQEGELDDAIELVRKSLSLRNEIGYRPGIAEAKLQLVRLLAEQGETEAAVDMLGEARVLAAELGMPSHKATAAVYALMLPGGDADAARADFAAHESRLDLPLRLELRHRLWRFGGAAGDLDAARTMLGHLREHAPEEYRETMIELVPVHSAVAAAG